MREATKKQLLGFSVADGVGFPMQRFPVHCESIRVVAADGERRRINVSGVEKARLLWLFRNFSILDFAVLDDKQRKLVVGKWYAGQATSAADEDVDDPFGLIGTIDGFQPKLYPAPAIAVKISRPSVRPALPPRPRKSVLWTAACVLLLGSTVLFLPRHRLTQSHATAVAATRPVIASVSSTPPTVVESASPSVATPAPVEVPAPSVPKAPESVPVAPRQLPDAMAANLSQPPALPASPAKARPPLAVAAKPPAKPEVMIRVTVNRDGRAESLKFVSGNAKKVSAALAAARRFHYEPCADPSVPCEHMLKYTDFGDASTLRVIQ